MDWIAILTGFGVGAIVGMTGVGGGSLMTPLLLTVFKLNPALAIGTDLWFAAITKTAGSAAHHEAGQVDWRITRWLLAGSIPASLGIALLLTAVTVAYKQVWQAVGLRLERWLPESRKPLLTMLCGLVLGVLV